MVDIEYIRIPKAALDWLNGEAPDPAGLTFGDFPEDHPRPPGAFWWRTTFRDICDYYAARSPFPAGVTEAAVEAAADALARAFTPGGEDVPYEIAARAALLAAIPLLSPSMGWEIKKLEWDGLKATTPFGRYLVHSDPFGWVWKRLGGDPFTNRPVFQTEDEAKAAAQADYEARIRSALLHPANGEGR